MKIIGTGHDAPKTTLSNDDLSRFVETNDEWIKSRTGIERRHITTEDNTSNLAARAAFNAIKKANIALQDIDLILVATCTPDAFFPSVASQVQEKLGIETAMAFDLNAACSGFVYGLTVAKSLMDSGGFRYALLIGAETLSKIVDWHDRDTCVLFGDGAGAVVLQPSLKTQFLYNYCAAKPDTNKLLVTGGIPLINPFTTQNPQSYAIKMQGQDVFKFAVQTMTDSINQVMDHTNHAISEIDYLICHQANYRILKNVAKKLKISEERFFMNLQEYGNTSAASIPMALSEMVEKDLLKPGMKLILIGFGAGLTWGASLIEW